MNMIKDEEGFSDNDFACAANCIVASAELAGTYIAIGSQDTQKKAHKKTLHHHLF
ncbi:hypothetical protein EDB87DRAFT_1831968, partial [Lactarius vividus]